MAENFDLIFGQNASQQYAWNDADYQNGWETFGKIPPTAAQFDALQRRSDTKLKELNDELTPLVNADTADSRQPSTTYSKGDIKYSSLLPTGWYLECTTAGITSASEIVLPTPIAEGDTVTDGEVVWTIRKISSGADIPIATKETNGLMSAADKTKLNGIANNANNYSLPAATSSTRGGVTVGSNISLSGDKISLTSANVTNALGYTPPSTTGANASGNWNINAATAAKLATPRKINITGNASGSANFDGSGDVSINVTVNESKHAVNANTATTANTATNAASATNADKLDGYHASDLLRTLSGNKTPVITDIFDRAGTIDMSTMSAADKATHKANINKASNMTQNIWNTDTGIHAYGGDYEMNGYNKGTLKLTQSYKNFDKILVVNSNKAGDWILYDMWDVWELAHAFANSYRFNLLIHGTMLYWDLYGTAKHGTTTDYAVSTDTVWSCPAKSGGIVAIYGIKF